MVGSPYLLSCLFVVGAGVSVTLQQVLNANLRTQIGSPWWAAFVSYFVGTLVTLFAALAFSPTRMSFPALPAASWMSWSGGFFGAIFIVTAIVMLPRLGAATVLGLVVVGQMGASLAFDHFGLLGLAQHSANPVRLLGAALLVVGVILIRL